MPAIGPWELIVVLVIVVVIFGAGRLSEVGGALGKSIREFRKASSDDHAAQATAPPPVAPAAPAAPLPASAPVPAATVENKCPSCATVNPTGQVFCGQCGTRLTRAA
jgi:sec-independent protein translocase protein TatA